MTFHYIGWLIGVPVMAFLNPYIAAAVVFHPICTASKQGELVIAHLKTPHLQHMMTKPEEGTTFCRG